ncbi:MAG: glycosyltransferase [Candidatus Cryptobacteroides sp.]
MSKKLLQINPVLRTSTSTGRIMKEIGELAMANGWESYVAYSKGRDGLPESTSIPVPVGSRASVAWHGLQTRVLDRHGLGSELATKRFIEDIRRIGPDIIHIHNIHGYFLNYRILFDFLSKSGIQVIWTVHDCWLYTGHCYHYMYAGCDRWKTGCGHCPQTRKFPQSWFRDRSARNFRDKRDAFCSMPADRLTIVPVSDWIRSEMSESFLKDYRFQVIHNGIDTTVFSPQPQASSEVRNRYGLGDRHIILGIASIWSEEKGLNDFVEMAGKLAGDEIIVLVGMDREMLDRTLSVCGKECLADRIVPVKRTADVHQLAELYSTADVLVNPTWQDNYPTVNLEAISCGTPVVTYRTGGSIEAVTEDTGYIVNQGDVDGLLSAVRRVESLGKEHFRENCRSRAVENFRKEDRYAEYIELYDRLTK